MAFQTEGTVLWFRCARDGIKIFLQNRTQQGPDDQTGIMLQSGTRNPLKTSNYPGTYLVSARTSKFEAAPEWLCKRTSKQQHNFFGARTWSRNQRSIFVKTTKHNKLHTTVDTTHTPWSMPLSYMPRQTIPAPLAKQKKGVRMPISQTKHVTPQAQI